MIVRQWTQYLPLGGGGIGPVAPGGIATRYAGVAIGTNALALVGAGGGGGGAAPGIEGGGAGRAGAGAAPGASTWGIV